MDTRQVNALRLHERRGNLPPTVGPQSIGIALTNACNLNCITCWSYSPLKRELPRVEWQRKRLERDVLQAVFDDARNLRTERVIFTGGGDPLAHPAFYDIAADAKARGLKVTLISNLTLARDRERLAALNLDTVLANFSSGDPETYAAFHPNRSPDDFAKLLDTLQAVKAGGTSLKLVFVVCAVNVHVLGEAVAIAASLGASIQWKRVSVTAETTSMALTETHRAELFARIPTLKADAEARGVLANWDIFAAELRGETLATETVNETGCHAGHFYARIGANGDVRFCCNLNPTLRVGSIHESRFADLWNESRYQELRNDLNAGRFISGCEQCGKLDLNRRVWLSLLPTV